MQQQLDPEALLEDLTPEGMTSLLRWLTSNPTPEVRRVIAAWLETQERRIRTNPAAWPARFFTPAKLQRLAMAPTD